MMYVRLEPGTTRGYTLTLNVDAIDNRFHLGLVGELPFDDLGDLLIRNILHYWVGIGTHSKLHSNNNNIYTGGVFSSRNDCILYILLAVTVILNY